MTSNKAVYNLSRPPGITTLVNGQSVNGFDNFITGVAEPESGVVYVSWTESNDNSKNPANNNSQWTWVDRFTNLDSSPVWAAETAEPYDSECMRARLWNRISRNGHLYLQVFANSSSWDIIVEGWRYDASPTVQKLVRTGRKHTLSTGGGDKIVATATSPDGLWAVASVWYGTPRICRFLPHDPSKNVSGDAPNDSAFTEMSGVQAAVDGSTFVFTGDYYLPGSTSVTGSYSSFNASTSYTDAFPRMIYWHPVKGISYFRVIQNPYSAPSTVYTMYDGANSLSLYNIGAPGQSDSGVQRSLPNMFMLPNSKKLVYSATKESNGEGNNCIGVSFETTPGDVYSWQHKLAYEWHEAGKKIGRLEYQVVVANGVSTETCYVGIMDHDANVAIPPGIAETGMKLYSFVIPANNQLQQSDFKPVDLEPDNNETKGAGVSSFGVFKNGDILYRNNFHTRETYRVPGAPPVPGGFADQATYDAAKLAVGGDSEITKANYDAVLQLWNLKVDPDVTVLPPPAGSPAVAPAKALYEAMKGRVLNSGQGSAGSTAGSAFASFADLAKMAVVTGQTAAADATGATGLVTFREAEAVRLLLADGSAAAVYLDANLTSANYISTVATPFIEAGAGETSAKFPTLAELADAVRASNAGSKIAAEAAVGDRETYLFAKAVRANPTDGVGPTTEEYNSVKNWKPTVKSVYPPAESLSTKLTFTANDATSPTDYVIQHITSDGSTTFSQVKPFVGNSGDPPLKFVKGKTYILTYPSSHPLRIYKAGDTSPFSTGVTIDEGSSKLTFAVPSTGNIPSTLYYKCTNPNHLETMSGAIFIRDPLTVSNFKANYDSLRARVKSDATPGPAGTANPNATNPLPFSSTDELKAAVELTGVEFVNKSDLDTLKKMTADGVLNANKVNSLRDQFGRIEGKSSSEVWQELVYAAQKLGQNQSAVAVHHTNTTDGNLVLVAAKAFNGKWNKGGTVDDGDGDGVRFARFSAIGTKIPVDGASDDQKNQYGAIQVAFSEAQQLQTVNLICSTKLSSGTNGGTAIPAERPQKVFVATRNESSQTWTLLKSFAGPLTYGTFENDGFVNYSALAVQATSTQKYKQFLFVVFGASDGITQGTTNMIHVNEIQMFAGSDQASQSRLVFAFADESKSQGQLNTDRDAAQLKRAHTLATAVSGNSLSYNEQTIQDANNYRLDVTEDKKTDAAVVTLLAQAQNTAKTTFYSADSTTTLAAALSFSAFVNGFQNQRDYELARGIGVTKMEEITAALQKTAFKEEKAASVADVVQLVVKSGFTTLSEAVTSEGAFNLTSEMTGNGWSTIADVAKFKAASKLLNVPVPKKADVIALAKKVFESPAASVNTTGVILETDTNEVKDQKYLDLLLNSFKERGAMLSFQNLAEKATGTETLLIGTFNKGFSSDQEKASKILQFGGDQNLTMNAIIQGFRSEEERLMAKKLGYVRRNQVPLATNQTIAQFYDKRVASFRVASERALSLFSKELKEGSNPPAYNFAATSLTQKAEEFRISSATPIKLEATEIHVIDSEDVNEQTKFELLVTIKDLQTRLGALETKVNTLETKVNTLHP